MLAILSATLLAARRIKTDDPLMIVLGIGVLLVVGFLWGLVKRAMDRGQQKISDSITNRAIEKRMQSRRGPGDGR